MVSQENNREMRDVYCDALIKEGQKNDKICIVDNDLSLSMGTRRFAAKFPNRSINMGIMEAHSCSAAAGMATTGLIPFVHSLAVFSSRRMCDQIFLSCAYANTNVKIIGGDSGVAAALNGGTHMAFEDIGVLRSIPNITIVEPSDIVMMEKLVPIVAQTKGLFYMRYARRIVPRIYEPDLQITLGKAHVLKEGADITLISCGMTVYECLVAAEELEKEGYSVGVADMFTIKPIDKDYIIETAKKSKAILVVENHNVIGGLGTAVAEVLAENTSVKFKRMGINDTFGIVGKQDFLMDRFKLTSPYIKEQALELMAKKY